MTPSQTEEAKRAEETKRLRKRARGPRPRFLDERHADELFSMVCALMQEIAVVRERLDTFARLAEREGIFSHQDVEDFRPDSAIIADREEWRRAYIRRVLRTIFEESEALRKDRWELATIEEVVQAVSEAD